MRLNLNKGLFVNENLLLTHGKLEIKAFTYPSGVEALLVSGERISFVFTPFKGQQIWHLKIDGKEISMKTEVKEPQATEHYLENYGGFLYHCGVCSFGAPDPEHPQHGELPNAKYGSAYIECDEDEGGKYIVLGGTRENNVAFVRRYRFSPRVKLYESATDFSVTVKLENLRSYPMEYMYLCHVNFDQPEKARIYSTFKCDTGSVKVYRTDGTPELCAYFDELDKDLSLMNVVGDARQCYDPEICFGIKHIPDSEGYAHSLMTLDGGAVYISHPTDALPYAIRWMSKTENESAAGICLPSTGEHLGYKNAKEKGQIKYLSPNGTLEFTMRMGWLDAPDAEKMKKKIEKLI